MYKILQEKMSGVGGEAIDFARSLVETPSLSLAEERVADLVERKMQALGYAKVFRDDYGNVVGLLAGMHSAPTVLLNSHMDTVSASEGASTAPAVQDEQRLYGLGAADCKGGLAAQVFAGALLKRCLLPLKGNFILAATTAEKNGLSIGLRGLLAHTLPELGLKPDFAILGEPTGLGLYYGHDGWMEVDVRLEGITPFAAKDALGLIMHNMAPAQSSQREMLRVLASDHTHMAHQNAVSLRVAKRIGEEEDSQTALTQVQARVPRAAEAAGSRVAVG
ncbi:MAG: M20/M25/M40 family metallo-hydrolase, partial [Lentisphaerae bacterium]|nr:M20/M25/M40 family metallo-hydrolase [Lentisphaerota bacterium]